MIKKVTTYEQAVICDELLTKLIQDERKYDESIEEDFIVRDYFTNIIKNGEYFLYVYLVEDKIIGYTYAKQKDEESYLIDGLYIEEEYRGNGYSKELLNHIINELNKKGIKHIDINVIYENKIAYNLYKSLGFGEFKVSLRKDM